MLSIKDISESKVLNTLIILTISIFYIKIFHLYDHYPILDEVIVLDRYLEWKNFLRKDHIGNHTINSFVGVLLKTIFGYNFELLRFTSFTCFMLILILFRLMFNRIYLYLIFISLIIFSNYLFNYMYIFRGYYVHAILCTLSFFFIRKYFYYEKKETYLNIILFLVFVQLSHSLLTIYTAIPIFIMMIIEHFRTREILKYFSNYLFFLIIPTILAYTVYSFLEGFVWLHNDNLNFNFLIENFFLIFFDCVIGGLKFIFLSDYTPSTISALPGVINQLFDKEPIFIIVYFVSFLFALFNLLKYKKYLFLDLLIIFIFLFFIILFKQPPLRVHIGPVIFCAFYIINHINFNFNNYKFENKPAYIVSSFIICLILISTVTPKKEWQQLKEQVIKINKYKDNCSLANEKLNSSDKWILINYFPKACKHRYDGNIQDNFLY